MRSFPDARATERGRSRDTYLLVNLNTDGTGGNVPHNASATLVREVGHTLLLRGVHLDVDVVTDLRDGEKINPNVSFDVLRGRAARARKLRGRGGRRRRGSRRHVLPEPVHTVDASPALSRDARGAFPEGKRGMREVTYPEGAEERGRVQGALLAKGAAEHVARAMAKTARAGALVTHPF